MISDREWTDDRMRELDAMFATLTPWDKPRMRRASYAIKPTGPQVLGLPRRQSQIALLGLGENSVKVYVHSILRATGLKNRTAIAIKLILDGLA